GGVQGHRRVARELRRRRRQQVQRDPRPERDGETAGRSEVTPSLLEDRRRWMSLLALAPTEGLEAGWRQLAEPPPYRVVRGPEVGLVMVRGRAGGTGSRFNLGEMTVTRCTVEVEDGAVGHGYVGGRDRRHAELAAVFDAMLQDDSWRPAVEEQVIARVE